ncbi:hypothetical protein BpHYR1_005466 [Brachionus plicatilis]|uniref:FLYWCH-type domain-containing protein n=1 Tax=Brachionus plicatilis TaxID=10195 RepID=A0A3M7S3E1_BRAPC|nr:hypothetical protein BpHYR1_005466 [Brachionus plicatilis]
MAQAIDVDNLTDNFNSISINQIGQVTLSQKNCPQLHYKNHFYKISTENSLKCIWRCVKNNRNKSKIDDFYHNLALILFFPIGYFYFYLLF